MALSIHSGLVKAAGSSGMSGMDVLVCASRNAVQLILVGRSEVLVRQALAVFLFHIARQIHRSIIQLLHGVGVAIALDLSVDVVMLGSGVHHQIQDILLCGINGRNGADFLIAGVAGLGNGGLDGRGDLGIGLELLIILQLAGLGRDSNINRLVLDGLSGAVDLDSLDDVA